MKPPPFFAPLWRSWMPGAYYRELARHGRGGGVLWLFVLTLLTSGVLTWTLARTLHDWRTVRLPAALDEMDKGATGQPVEVRDPDSGELLVVVLPAAAAVPPQYADVPLVFLRDRLVGQGEGLGQLIGVKKYGEAAGAWDREKIEARVARVARLVPWVVFPVLCAVWFAWRLGLWLTLAVAAAIANAVFDARLRFGALLRLTAAAMTPASLLIAAGAALHLRVPFWFALALAGTVVLLALAVRTAGAPPPVVAPPAA